MKFNRNTLVSAVIITAFGLVTTTALAIAQEPQSTTTEAAAVVESVAPVSVAPQPVAVQTPESVPVETVSETPVSLPTPSEITVSVQIVTVAPIAEPTTEAPTTISVPIPTNNWIQTTDRFGAIVWQCDNNVDCSDPPVTPVCLFADGFNRQCNTGSSSMGYPMYNSDGSVTTIAGREFPINGGGWIPSGVDSSGNQLSTWHDGRIG